MKNIKVLQRFSKTRRSAIAVTMAIALVPLVLLIGIAVDVTFLSQDRGGVRDPHRGGDLFAGSRHQCAGAEE